MDWAEALQGRKQMLKSQQAYASKWADYSGLQTYKAQAIYSRLQNDYFSHQLGYVPTQYATKSYVNTLWADSSNWVWPANTALTHVNYSDYYTTAADTTYTPIKSWYDPAVPISPVDRLREILRARRAPTITSRRVALVPLDAKELRARETLRLVVGETNYRSYLRHGHVTARNAASGRVYQIFAGLGLTKVYEKGVCIERLCVHLTHGFTATDNLIVRYLMCLNNEARLWQLANKHGVVSGAVSMIVKPDFRPLPAIFAELKQPGQISLAEAEEQFFAQAA